jgi:predicted MFS family arabinose efflux permease
MSASAPDTTSKAFADVSVRAAIALAFADASVVVLALPQVVVRLHTSISHVTWVITAYNLALIASTLAVLPFASRLATRRALIAGLAVFGLASIGSGAASDLTMLIVFRCVQGAGGGLVVCSSLPLFTGDPAGGGGSLRAWATTAALGAAIGPAAGGLLTQVFDWRAIFFAQAPIAALAAAFALAGHLDPRGAADRFEPEAGRPPELLPGLANVALGLISAGLIGALFLATVLLINVWQLSPLGAAAVLLVIPVATAVSGEAVAGRGARLTALAGALVLSLGLALFALLTHRELVLAVGTLGLCGVGLGLGFPSLTNIALETRGPAVAQAARTVASREGGLVLGLVVLTPVLVNQLHHVAGRATPPITSAIIQAPMPLSTKLVLGAGLTQANAKTPQSELPNFAHAFANAGVHASAPTRATLASLQVYVHSVVVRAATRAFRIPLELCAVLSLLAILPITLGRRRAPPAQ